MNDSSQASPYMLRLLVCLVLSIIAAAIAYGVGHELPSTYADSGTIRVGTPTQSGIADTNVQATNDLTSQYAQLVSSNPVAAIAAKSLGVTQRSLKDQLTGGVVAAQNILQVTGTGSSASQATARTEAGVRAVQSYLIQVTSDQNSKYAIGLVKQFRANNTGTSGRTSTSSAAIEAQSALNTAIDQALRDAAGNQPTFQIVNLTTGGATITNPKPKLYALVTFLVVLLLSVRIAFVLKPPKTQ